MNVTSSWDLLHLSSKSWVALFHQPFRCRYIMGHLGRTCDEISSAFNSFDRNEAPGFQILAAMMNPAEAIECGWSVSSFAGSSRVQHSNERQGCTNSRVMTQWPNSILSYQSYKYLAQIYSLHEVERTLITYIFININVIRLFSSSLFSCDFQQFYPSTIECVPQRFSISWFSPVFTSQ